MATLTEGRHAAEFILSEAAGSRSRDTVTVAAGSVLEAGAVVGRISASGEVAGFDPAASDGRETAAGVIIHPVDASNGPVEVAAITRDAEVRRGALVFADTVTEVQQAAALNTLATDGIIAR